METILFIIMNASALINVALVRNRPVMLSAAKHLHNLICTHLQVLGDSAFERSPGCSSGNISAIRIIISSVISCNPTLRETPDGSTGIYGLPICTFTLGNQICKERSTHVTCTTMGDRQNSCASACCKHCCSSIRVDHSLLPLYRSFREDHESFAFA